MALVHPEGGRTLGAGVLHLVHLQIIRIEINFHLSKMREIDVNLNLPCPLAGSRSGGCRCIPLTLAEGERRRPKGQVYK